MERVMIRRYPGPFMNTKAEFYLYRVQSEVVRE